MNSSCDDIYNKYILNNNNFITYDTKTPNNNNALPKIPNSTKNTYKSYVKLSPHEFITSEKPLFHEDNELRLQSYKHYMKAINNKMNLNTERYMKYMQQQYKAKTNNANK